MNLKYDEIWVVAAVLHRQHRHDAAAKEVLIVRRASGETGAGFWEFPGGKVELGESPEAALRREIAEELGIEIQIGSLIGERVHAYPQKKIRLRVYWASTHKYSPDLVLTEHDASEWCKPETIDLQILSEADRSFVRDIILIDPHK